MSKILIVDDEPPIIDVLSYNLKQAGYEVVIARDGGLLSYLIDGKGVVVHAWKSDYAPSGTVYLPEVAWLTDLSGVYSQCFYVGHLKKIALKNFM